MTQTTKGFYDDITRPDIDNAGRIVNSKAITLPYAAYAKSPRSLASMRLTREDFVSVMYQALTNSFLLADTRKAGNVERPTAAQKRTAKENAAKYIHDNHAFQDLIDKRWDSITANNDATTLANYYRLIVDSVKAFASDVSHDVLAIDDSKAPDSFKPNLHDFSNINNVMTHTLTLARNHNTMTDVYANLSAAWDGVYDANRDSIVLRHDNKMSDMFVDNFAGLLDTNSLSSFKAVVDSGINDSKDGTFTISSRDMANLINTMIHLRNNGVDFTLKPDYVGNGFCLNCSNVYNTSVSFNNKGLTIYQNGYVLGKADSNRKGTKFVNANDGIVNDSTDDFRLLDAALGIRAAQNLGFEGNHVALDFDVKNINSGRLQVRNTSIPAGNFDKRVAMTNYRQMIAPIYSADDARVHLADKLHTARSQFFDNYLTSLADDNEVDENSQLLYNSVVTDIQNNYDNPNEVINALVARLCDFMHGDGDIYNNADMDAFLDHFKQHHVNIDTIKQLYQNVVDETNYYVGEAPIVNDDGTYSFGRFNPTSLMNISDETNMSGRDSVINILRQIPGIVDCLPIDDARKNHDTSLLKAADALVMFDSKTGHNYDYYRKASMDALAKFKADNNNADAKHEAFFDASLARLARYADNALTAAGVTDTDVQIDDNGILRWHGTIELGAANANTTMPVHVSGDIGQLFPVDDRGLLKRNFKYSGNKYLAIGNKGFYALDDHFDSKTGRLRITGYEQLMHRLINQTVDRQLFRASELTYSVTSQRTLGLNAGKVLAWAAQQAQFKETLSDITPLIYTYTNADTGVTSYLIKKGKVGQANTFVDFMVKNHFAKTADDATLANYCKAHGIDTATLVDAYLDANNPTIAGRNLSAANDAAIANTAYTNQLYTNSVPETLVKDVAGDTRDRELKDTIISDMASIVRFSKQYVHDSTTASLSPAMYHSTYNSLSANLSDHQNTRESSSEDAQFFDEISLGSGGTQGGQRRLTAHQYARLQAIYKQAIRDNNVLPTALIADDVKSFDDVSSRSLIRTLATKRGWLSQASRTPFDRGQMYVSQLLSASNIAEGVNATYASFGGWTAEDSCVISQEFANKHMIDDGTGHYRPLMPGDKLSDANGNKGVISLVVDRHMDDDYEQAYQRKYGKMPAFDDPNRPSVKRNLATEVGIFRQLANLDVVFDPEAPISRQNMGVIGEGMLDDHPQRLVCTVNGKHYDLGTSTKRMVIITKEAVDRNEHVYSDDGCDNNTGRHFGGLATGVISEYGLSSVLPALLFGYSNQRNWNDVNSMFNVLGYDLAPDSRIYRITDGEVANNQRGFAHPGERFHCYDIGKLLFGDNHLNYDERLLRAGVDKYLNNGGFASLKNISAAKINAFKTQLQKENMPTMATLLNKDIGYTHSVTGSNILADADRYDKVAIKLPFKVPMLNPQTGRFDGKYQSDTFYVMPSAVRANSDIGSRTEAVKSDVSRKYVKLLDSVINVYAAASKFAYSKTYSRNGNTDSATSKQFVRYAHEYQNAKQRVANSVMAIQRSIYDQLGADGTDSNKKRNSALRNKLFKPAAKDSATLVAHADPRLHLGEVSVSEQAMKEMHAKPGDWVLVNRDPMQNTGNWEAMRLAKPYPGEENNLGLAMNPIECSHFDGDFDGDKYGVKHIDLDKLSPEARRLCEQDLMKMSAANTLIDKGHLTHLAIDNGQLGVAKGASTTLGVGVEDVAGWLNLDDNDDGIFSKAKYQQALAARHQTISDVKQLLLGKTDKITKNINNKPVDITADDAYSVKDFINDQITAMSKKIVLDSSNIQQQQADMQQLDSAIRSLRHNNFGAIKLYVDNKQPDKWLTGFETMAATGAKGNAKKLALCKQYYDGFNNEVTGHVNDNEQLADSDKVRTEYKEFDKANMTALRNIQNSTQKAAGIKTDYTGVAGEFEQRLTKVLRAIDPVMACESGAIIYQSLLQAKHDPIDAQKRVNLLVQLSNWMSGKDGNGRKYKDSHQQLADGEQLFLGRTEKNLPAPSAKIEKTLSAQSVLQEDTIVKFLKQVSNPANKKHTVEGAYKQQGITAMDELLYGNGVVSIAELAESKQPLVADSQTHNFMPVQLVNEAYACEREGVNYDAPTVDTLRNAIAQEFNEQLNAANKQLKQDKQASQQSWDNVMANKAQQSAVQAAQSQATSQTPQPSQAPRPHTPQADDGMSL